MANKISNFVFLILLFLLQSCSGGKIGNFLESSFRVNNSNKISQNDFNKKLKNDIVFHDKKFLEQNDPNNASKFNDKINSKDIVNSLTIKKNDGNIIKKKDQNFNPKSYRIFLILKKVNPSFPTEKFSEVLRNGDINFEIEKIELITELNQNKK